MLIEFRVKNFLSIRDEISISMTKSKGDELVDTNVIEPEESNSPTLLRSAVIYGANAAGKSNFIKAFEAIREIVLNSAANNQAGGEIPVTPFLFDDINSAKPSEFEVVFMTEGVRYQYGFVATKNKIIDEWLLAFPIGRPQRWIERSYKKTKEVYSWGSMDKLTGQKHVWQNATRPNALFLSTAIQLNSSQLKPVFNWFKHELHITGIGGWSPGYSVKLCEEENTKNDVLKFLQYADINIDDIFVEREAFDPTSLPKDTPDYVRKDLEERFKGKSIANVKTYHTLLNGENVPLDMKNESDGTQKLFALAGPWLDTLENGYVLVIDELHDNLHPLMVQFLVKLFHSSETNPKNAQLIFTTHDTSILNQDIFRRDQVWFFEKNKAFNSTLFPLTDFNVRKKVENLEQYYLSGRYGALPYLRDIKKAMGC